MIASDATSLSLTPISGYVSFGSGVNSSSLLFRSVDDSIPERSSLFSLSLTNVAGGAAVSSSQDTAIITILKSDSSNGIFGFTSNSLSSISEPGNTTLTVNRSEGMFGEVMVNWEVRDTSTGTVATQDFDPATGFVSFGEGEALQTFVVAALDETVPELRESFTVVLTSAVANDNESSSTALSGASIDDSRSQAMISIMENDSPYGVIQFSTSLPSTAQPLTLATVMPQLLVEESDAMVTVYVTRAQGTVGSVDAEFFTTDGTATSLGVEPDYVSTAGQLSFPAGVAVQSFNVRLLDDPNPELAKTFFVNLTNPQGGKSAQKELIVMS